MCLEIGIRAAVILAAYRWNVHAIENTPGFFIAVCAAVGQIVNVRSGLGGNAPGKLLSGSGPENLERGRRKRFSLLQKVNDDAGI